MRLIKLIFPFLLLFFLCKSFALNSPLPADQAFRFYVQVRDNQTILANWEIQPHYYLYRARFHFEPLQPIDLRFSQPLMPEALKKVSPEIGNYEVYEGHLIIPIPVLNPPKGDILMKVSYQGCSLNGYCYPPTQKIVAFNMSAKSAQKFYPMNIDIPAPKTENSSQKNIETLFESGNAYWFLMGFFGFGLLISLTPCVLPMIPILSSIILGQKHFTHRRSFGISVAYVFGMAITYSIAGALFGYFGKLLQVYFQNPWIIGAFSLIFVLMALSMFGFYNIELPNRLRSKIAITSEHQKRGSYFGAFIMGILSTLILSPCVTAPLVGVLAYISETGNAVLGACALFTMALGMGAPLLIIGGVGPQLLPKTGAWMNTIKILLGFMLLFMAVYLLSRIISPSLSLSLSAIIFVILSIYLGAFHSTNSKIGYVKKGFGIGFFILSILIFAFTYLNRFNSSTGELSFIPVKTVSEIEHHIKKANESGQPVILDFYADWCVSCKTMDHFTFANPSVATALSHFVRLRADVSENNANTQALEQNYNVVAPPTILFFSQGEEIQSARIIGEMSAPEFLNHLKKISLKSGKPI